MLLYVVIAPDTVSLVHNVVLSACPTKFVLSSSQTVHESFPLFVLPAVSSLVHPLQGYTKNNIILLNNHRLRPCLLAMSSKRFESSQRARYLKRAAKREAEIGSAMQGLHTTTSPLLALPKPILDRIMHHVFAGERLGVCDSSKDRSQPSLAPGELCQPLLACKALYNTAKEQFYGVVSFHLVDQECLDEFTTISGPADRLRMAMVKHIVLDDNRLVPLFARKAELFPQLKLLTVADPYRPIRINRARRIAIVAWLAGRNQGLFGRIWRFLPVRAFRSFAVALPVEFWSGGRLRRVLLLDIAKGEVAERDYQFWEEVDDDDREAFIEL